MHDRQNNELSSAKLLLSKERAAIIVRIVSTKGSTPREKAAVMIVSKSQIFGSIGGGKLEWLAMKKARDLMEENAVDASKSIIEEIGLGPEIDQCCGGSVELEYSLLTANALDDLHKEQSNIPYVFVFGAGHVGEKLVKLFCQLPVRLKCIDTRPEFLESVSDYCEAICTPLPEAEIKNAPPKSAFIITTHEHQLDFLLTAEALARRDAAYVGMIGSKTKRAVFKNWLVQQDYDDALIKQLICPIGKVGKTQTSSFRNKEPSIIAALTVSEVLQRL